MRILSVFPAYEPAWPYGGVVRCTSNLCRGLAASGVEVSVYTTNVDGQGGLLPAAVGAPVDVGGVSVTYFPSTFGRHSVWDSRALIRCLNKTIQGFDLVYVAAVWQWLGVAVGRVARRNRVPYVIGTHGALSASTLRHGGLRKSVYWHLFLKRCVRGARALHFTSEYESRQADLLRGGPPGFLVPNCLQVEEFNVDDRDGRQVRERYGIAGDAPVLLAVGRSDPIKRLDVLLESFREVAGEFPDGRLLMVGPCDNRYGRDMRNLCVRSGISDRVIWTGYQEGRDLAACYAAADLLVLTSSHENFGMVAAEALAAGVPVVVSNRVGIAEDVKSKGVGVVTDLESGRVAHAILNLLRDRPRMAEMGRKAPETARRLYGVESVSRRMRTAYRDVLQETRDPACRWV